MHLFYTPDISSDIYTLSEEESRHCQKVLRLREGDIIHLTDGMGVLYAARLVDASGKQVTVEVTDKMEGESDSSGSPSNHFLHRVSEISN